MTPLPTTIALTILALNAPFVGRAQSSTRSEGGALVSPVLIGEQDFFDIGPPFDFYTVYVLTPKQNGTQVERLSITPPGDACFHPASISSTQTRLTEGLPDLLQHKDPCSISEKELRKEAKRCKHCAIFSGVHISMQVQCQGKARLIRYEVLDRDLFDASPNTPQNTSGTFKLLESLNTALGPRPVDKPIFPLAADIPIPRAERPSEAELALAKGDFDSLFPAGADTLSTLYREAQVPLKKPSVTLLSSQPITPQQLTLPNYPPIAIAAHVEGKVTLQVLFQPDGHVASVSTKTGPPMLAGASIDAAKKWTFPASAASQSVDAALEFRLNCYPSTAK